MGLKGILGEVVEIYFWVIGNILMSGLIVMVMRVLLGKI